MNEKKCKICNMTKQIIEFSPAAKYKDKQYYRGECKECNRLVQSSDQTAQIKYRNSVNGHYKKWKYKKDKKESDPFYKAKENIRRRLRKALESKNWRKTTKFADYIGCDRETFITYFESKFTPGMFWELLGKNLHIDHIIPLSSATSEEEMYKLCHYTNLQPLWALDNIKKSNKR